MVRKLIRPNFRLATILYALVLDAVLLGWVVDHIRLTRKIDKLMIDHYIRNATHIP